MDYDFTTDEYNNPVAEFSLGHEAIGCWLTDELGIDQQAIAELLQVIQRLEQRSILQHQVVGREFQLRMSHDHVEVIALALDIDIDIDETLPENTNLYDQESYAECGMDDFKQAILEWQQFV